MQSNERHISLFRNGRNQAIRIPREFELKGSEAIIRKVDNKLIIEPIPVKNNLRALLSSWEPLGDDLTIDVSDINIEAEDIF